MFFRKGLFPEFTIKWALPSQHLYPQTRHCLPWTPWTIIHPVFNLCFHFQDQDILWLREDSVARTVAALPSKLGLAPQLRPVLSRTINVNIGLHFMVRFFTLSFSFLPWLFLLFLQKGKQSPFNNCKAHSPQRP